MGKWSVEATNEKMDAIMEARKDEVVETTSYRPWHQPTVLGPD
jgi:hypothetical protein